MSRDSFGVRRVRAGLTIITVARLLQISDSAYARFERPQRRGVQYKTLPKVCEILNLPISELGLTKEQLRGVIRN